MKQYQITHPPHLILARYLDRFLAGSISPEQRKCSFVKVKDLGQLLANGTFTGRYPDAHRSEKHYVCNPDGNQCPTNY